jgi:TolB-like protein
MKGFNLGDCADFSDWQFQQSEYYRRSLASALKRLAEEALLTSSFEAGIESARRLVRLDGLDEEAHRLLMRLYGLAGQWPAAIRQYQVCRKTLRDELELDPETETSRLYEEIRQRKLAPSISAPVPDRAHRLAVLPFATMSSDPDHAWFADSMTDAMITALSRERGLQVISYTSTSRYPGTDKSIRQIAGELNVTHVLEGAVLRVGSEVRISAQLIDATTDEHIWANSEQSPFQDILTLQSRLARSIAGEIVSTLAPPADQPPESPVVPEAHEAVLFGDYLLGKGGVGSDEEALSRYEEALRLAPDYPPALAGRLFIRLSHWVYRDSREQPSHEESRRLVLEWADRVLVSDPDNLTAMLARSAVTLYWDWDIEAARKEDLALIERGIEHARLFGRMSALDLYSGRFEDSIRWSERERELDPVDPYTNQGLVASLIYGGYHRRALALLERMLGMYPGFERIYGSLALVYCRTGRTDDAVRYAEIVKDRIEIPMVMGYAGRVLAELGEVETAEGMLAKMNRLESQGRQVASIHFAQVLDELGRTEEAIDRLEQAYESHEAFLLGLAHLPEWERLRARPRCAALIKKIGN